MSSTKNIAKNSLFLYVRMLLNMGVGIFTAGIVLNTLGITDYGIYNIVGGFVSMFSFLNSSMSSATQRFLSFDLGKNDLVQLKKTFSTTVTIHFVIALLIVFALETFGLWYINYKLNVPENRMLAVNVVFQFSVLTSFFSIIQVPYNALITAHERFNVYAYISFLEIAFKLLILYFLIHIQHDKLILYSILLFISSFIMRMIYRIYCRKNFSESHYFFYFDHTYFKTLISFTGWNLFGNIAAVAKGQGNNLVLNIFFGTIMNAAYGITLQFQGIVTAFVANFQNAVNPQIVKNYATGNIERSVKLIYQSAKFSFGLMITMALPISLSLQLILDLWLKNYPAESITFIRLAFINILIDTISNPIMFGLQATGKMKWYQIVVGTLLFLNLPISYFLIKVTNQPEIIFEVSIFISLLALGCRLYFLKIQMNVPIVDFFNKVIIPVLLLSIVVTVVYYVTKIEWIPLSNKYLNLLIKSLVLGIITALSAYILLFSKVEKENLKLLYFNKTNRK